jgi:predicted nucleotidyltransferase
MSALVTPQERADLLENLLTLLKDRADVIGVVMSGSGVSGFIDSYSDVDLMVIFHDDVIFPLAYGKLKDAVFKILAVDFHYEILRSSEDIVLMTLLHNYLEIDMQVVKARYVVMRDRDYKILYDKNQVLEDLLDDAFSETQTLSPRRVYLDIVERIWQPILKCVSALNRNQTWRAMHMLEEIRNQTVHLAGMNHRLSTREFAQVDDLPEMFLINLRHTIPTNTSNVAIRRALRMAVGMFFAEALILEPNLKIDVARKMQARIVPYVEAYS